MLEVGKKTGKKKTFHSGTINKYIKNIYIIKHKNIKESFPVRRFIFVLSETP